MEKNLCTTTVDSRNYSHEFRLLFLSSIFAVIYNFHKCYEVEFCAKYLQTITITPYFCHYLIVCPPLIFVPLRYTQLPNCKMQHLLGKMVHCNTLMIT